MVRQLLRVLWIVGVIVLSPVWLFATVTRIEITTREPYLEGREFDGVGSYERLRGKVFFAVDPKHAANQAVIDLELAPFDERTGCATVRSHPSAVHPSV